MQIDLLTRLIHLFKFERTRYVIHAIRMSSVIFITLELPSCESATTLSEIPKDGISTKQSTEITSHEFEVEPGHIVSIRRLSDNSIVYTEIGRLEHRDILGDTPRSQPIDQIVKNLSPNFNINTLFLSPPSESTREISVNTEPNPKDLPSDTQVIDKAAPWSTDVFSPINAPVADDYAVLNCDNFGISSCISGAGIAYGTLVRAGYHRAVGVNRAPLGGGTATLSIGDWTANVNMQLSPGQWGQIHFLPVTPRLKQASIVGPSGTPVGVSHIIGSMGPRAQERNNWCWIATAHMAISNFQDPIEQCEEGNAHWGPQNNCCSPGACDWGGEAMQVLKRRNYSFTSNPANDANRLRIALQASDPIILHHPTGPHYTILSDYTERREGSSWVPWAMQTDPFPVNDFSQQQHVRWVRLDDVGSFSDWFLSDIRPTPASLAITRISPRWNGSSNDIDVVVTAPPSDHTRIEYALEDAFSGAVWRSATQAYANSWAENGLTVTIPNGVDSWIWYKVRVRSCNDHNICTPFVYGTTTVTWLPEIFIDTASWNENTLSFNLRSNVAPQDTVFRYRIYEQVEWRFATPYLVGTLTGSQTVLGTVTANFSHTWSRHPVRLQAQACNSVGCSGWIHVDVN